MFEPETVVGSQRYGVLLHEVCYFQGGTTLTIDDFDVSCAVEGFFLSVMRFGVCGRQRKKQMSKSQK